MKKVTVRSVDALKPSKDRDVFLWDGELRGFGVRVKPSGLKSYLVQYRNADGATRRLVLGHHGVMTARRARDLARAKLVEVSEGLDPSAMRHMSREGWTVTQICDWYLEEAEAGRLLGRKRRPIKASTLAMDRSRINTHIRPLIGSRRVHRLFLVDIEAMQADVAAGKTAKPRIGSRGGATTGGAGVAARTVSTLHSILEHAVRHGLIDKNPARGVRRIASEARDRRLSLAEIRRLGKAIRFAEAMGEHPVGLAAIKLLLMTGFRRMECLALERAWIDLDQCCVRFPDTKSGAQVRVIGRAAAKLIASQSIRDTSHYLLPADRGDGHFVGVVSVLGRVCTEPKLADVTPHVLRHTFASVAAELGFSELTIAALLGHSARGVTQRYVHIDEALRVAADRVAAEIARLLGIKERATNVLTRRHDEEMAGAASDPPSRHDMAHHAAAAGQHEGCEGRR
jgi:site-specific recombinase XerD